MQHYDDDDDNKEGGGGCYEIGCEYIDRICLVISNDTSYCKEMMSHANATVTAPTRDRSMD